MKWRFGRKREEPEPDYDTIEAEMKLKASELVALSGEDAYDLPQTLFDTGSVDIVQATYLKLHIVTMLIEGYPKKRAVRDYCPELV